MFLQSSSISVSLVNQISDSEPQTSAVDDDRKLLHLIA
jgi:hypothetical protein